VDSAALLMAWAVWVNRLASAITAVWIRLMPSHGAKDGFPSALHGRWDALAHASPPYSTRSPMRPESAKAHQQHLLV